VNFPKGDGDSAALAIADGKIEPPKEQIGPVIHSRRKKLTTNLIFTIIRISIDLLE
jgi:hypothetical protein